MIVLMKNIFKYKSILAVALLATFASCNDDDDVTNTTRLEKPVITAAISSTSVTEGDEITVTLTSSKAISTAMEFKLDLLDTSTGNFRDFVSSGDETTITTGFGDIGHTITFPAYTTEYTFTITPEVDFNVEGSETLNFRFYGEGNARGMVSESSEFFTINVADYTSNDVGVRLVWDGSYADSFGTIVFPTYTGLNAQGVETEYEFAEWDFDVYVLDINSFEDVTGYAGATSAVPEESLVTADTPDGDYLIVADLYEPARAPIEPFTFNMHLDVTKFGTWSVSVPITAYNSDSPDSSSAGLDDGAMIIAVLTKAGTTYTLTDYTTNEVLAEGRKAQLLTTIKNKRIAKK